ncbi:MAG: bifunctional pyr operon transcriptional regulator/uracil phosphoribosyltransferase PyrR [Verrucomicrobiota bacterium]
MNRTLDATELAAGVRKLAGEIRTRNGGGKFALVGIRSRGDEVAERVRANLAGETIDFGVLDISLYRDDFEHLRENPTLQGTDLPFTVDGAHIILIDDVLFTGRTVRAALDAISHYGRPAKVELAVLVDRGHRELPIQPDYIGIRLDTHRGDHVSVSLQKTDGEDKVRIESKDTSP